MGVANWYLQKRFIKFKTTILHQITNYNGLHQDVIRKLSAEPAGKEVEQ